MKGLCDPSVVSSVAEKAVIYWTAKFEARKAAWIAEKSQEYLSSWFGLKKEQIGVERAEEFFEEPSFFSEHGGNGGDFWVESERIRIAKNLHALAENTHAEKMILTQAELCTLHIDED